MSSRTSFSRRDFIKSSSAAAAGLMQARALPVTAAAMGNVATVPQLPGGETLPEFISDRYRLDLSPARWIWYPAERTLPNTFFHFRRTVTLAQELESATGWIVGDSRYLLFCNGQRLQFGPPPADPRYTEADPVDLTRVLQRGENVIGATVLFYGFGDGTWPIGKPGFIFKLKLVFQDGSTDTLVSDQSWQVQLATSWRPGQYKRWYLRALQEEFDARNYPEGWHRPGFQTDGSWLGAREIPGRADETTLSTGISDYLYDSSPAGKTQLRRRMIPLLREERVPARRLVESHWVRWHRPPEEYFDLMTAASFEPMPGNPVQPVGPDSWTVDIPGPGQGAVLTFELTEQVVGWPFFTLEAPAGTVVELMVQEGHRPFSEGGPALMNNHFHSWTRFVLRGGRNELETFDFESVKWLQLHLHGPAGTVRVAMPGIRRRLYDFPRRPEITSSDKALQQLLRASVNTILNNSQDTIVDGMGRERQQYSGDIGHIVHVLHRGFGEARLPARFLSTFSQGLTKDGFFLDAWPAYDRLNRLAQRQLELTPWGPLLDHGVGFTFDAYYHYLYTGRAEDLEEVFPRLARFSRYLLSLRQPDGLLPVENIGIPTVWIDHDAYRHQRHKQLAFNAYAASMLTDALAPLCGVFGQEALQDEAREGAEQLVEKMKARFWSTAEGLPINNLPWYKEEGTLRTCDRSLAHFILSGWTTPDQWQPMLHELRTTPKRMGVSYPTNAHWRHWALAAGGQVQPILDEYRTRWLQMGSVAQNNTMQETWEVQPDANSQWSHAAVAPLYIAFMSLAGIAPLAPAYRKVRIRPQPGDLTQFSLVNHTPLGPLTVAWSGAMGQRQFRIDRPLGMEAELWLPEQERPDLVPGALTGVPGVRAWRLPERPEWKKILEHT